MAFIDSVLKYNEGDKSKPWLNPNLAVNICKLDGKKCNLNSHELKSLFLLKINKISREDSVHVYCDGSVQGRRVGCGVVIREFSHDEQYCDHMISKRIEDNASIMVAELSAIYEGLSYVVGMLNMFPQL